MFSFYHCPVKLLKRKKERAESTCGFSPNCYLCFHHKISDNIGKGTHFFGQPVYGQLIKCLNKDKIVEMSRNHGGERYIKSFDGWQHFVRRERQTVRKVL